MISIKYSWYVQIYIIELWTLLQNISTTPLVTFSNTQNKTKEKQ